MPSGMMRLGRGTECGGVPEVGEDAGRGGRGVLGSGAGGASRMATPGRIRQGAATTGVRWSLYKAQKRGQRAVCVETAQKPNSVATRLWLWAAEAKSAYWWRRLLTESE